MVYEKIPEETADSVEETENLQRAIPIFPLYSVILIACLVAVSICQLAVDGADSLLIGGIESVERAGFVKQAFANGQYWRILTGAALHGGVMHLFFNCYAFYVLGKLIETLSNRAHLAIIFLLAAIGGGLLSFIFLPDGNSVGASGGIIGFLGYLTIYGFLRRGLLTGQFLKNMLFNVGLIAAYGIYFRESIDNFAHLGGLIVGAVYGFIQIPRDLYQDPRKVSNLTDILGLSALAIFIAVSIFSILLIFRVI